MWPVLLMGESTGFLIERSREIRTTSLKQYFKDERSGPSKKD
jgi:hypothetical protein